MEELPMTEKAHLMPSPQLPRSRTSTQKPETKLRSSGLMGNRCNEPGDTSQKTGGALNSPLQQPNSSAPKVCVMSLFDFRLKWAMKKMVRKLHGLSVPQHNHSADVVEEWQKRVGEEWSNEEQSLWLLHYSQWPSRLLHPIITLIYLIVCWYVSVDVVFGIGMVPTALLVLWTSSIAVDIVLALNTIKICKGKSLRNRRTIALEYLRYESYLHIAMVFYLIANGLIGNQELDVAIHLIVLIAIVVKLSQKTQLLKTIFSFKKYIGLIDSALLLIVASHTSALLLFMSSKFVPQKSWLEHIGIRDSPWGSKYIYSIYWAVTTIVTVGYGDITPQNEYEVVVTIIIEVTGSALFGYLINVIGATMTDLKIDKENLQEELGIADKLVKCLSLDDDLSHQLKSFLKDNQRADSYFSLTDEKRVWDKLKPDLKQRILQDTNIRVIKKCLFFLTNFSRNLQDAVALKLVKQVFQPNERLGIEIDNQSLYIVDQGRVDLQFAKMHFHKPIWKTLRTINKDVQKGNLSISSNLFGFTSVILRKKVSLTAISRQFIVTYQLRQKDFDELVAQYPTDFETVCQLRDIILNTELPESYEGPELLDPSAHFVPIKHFAMKKHHRRSSRPQRRISKRRFSPCLSFEKFQLLNDSINEEDSATQSVQKADERRRTSILGSLRKNSLMLERAVNTKLVEEASEQQKIVSVSNVMDLFEQHKTYSKYMVNSNIDVVLRRFNPVETLFSKSYKSSVLTKRRFTQVV